MLGKRNICRAFILLYSKLQKVSVTLFDGPGEFFIILFCHNLFIFKKNRSRVGSKKSKIESISASIYNRLSIDTVYGILLKKTSKIIIIIII